MIATNNVSSETRPEGLIPQLAFTIPQARQVLGGVSDATVRRLLRRGKLRALQSLRHKLIPLAEIERFLKKDVE